jgi:hypothetical protein
MLADEILSEQSLHDAYDSISTVLNARTVDEVSRCNAQLVFHATCGDLRTAVDAARTLLARERQSGNPASVCRALRHGAVVLRRAGHAKEALTALEESYTLATKFAIVPAAFGACDAIADILLERLDISGVRLWYDRALKLNDHSRDPGDNRRLSHLAASIAVAEGRAEDAAAILKIVPNLVLADPFLRKRADAEATWVRIQLVRGESLVGDPLLQDLERLHASARSLGSHDFCAYSLYLGLCANGHADRANRLFAEYVQQYRREVGPLPEECKSVVEPSTATAAALGDQSRTTVRRAGRV